MEQPDEHRPSRNVLLQRVRNRIIEYLEVASSLDAQRQYQLAAPNLNVPNEVIHQWEDWISPDWKAQLVEPVFSSMERNGIDEFGQVWQAVVARVPNPMPPLDVLAATEPWSALMNGASKLEAVFALRGKLSEEHDDV